MHCRRKELLSFNAAGEVEPCAFVHFANVNIKNTSLVKALKSTLFQACQAAQPFNHNHLRPCPIIDNPKALEQLVTETGPYPTQKSGISASALYHPFMGMLLAWGKVADEIWSRNQTPEEQKA